ncbi:MAG: hypothetical protein M1823_003130 [Watsoniomyces obsoletus]|nr:MAG: hypothetical protein M1823_003130 [Watsoniomyces obsoletus]
MKGFFSIVGFAALFLVPAISASAIPVAQPEAAPAPASENKKLQSLEDAFAVLESIPDEVVDRGDDAARQWVREHTAVKNAAADDDDDESALEKRQIKDILQCAKALLETLPIGRAKRLIQLLGGWRKAAQKIRAAAKDPSKRRGVLKDLIDLLTGIPTLKKECWDDFRR